MDVAYRRLLRSVVGPPRNMDWTLPWHEVLQIWNERVRVFTWQAGSIQNMVGTLFTTPLECGTIFRNIAWALLDQKNLSLATSRA